MNTITMLIKRPMDTNFIGKTFTAKNETALFNKIAKKVLSNKKTCFRLTTNEDIENFNNLANDEWSLNDLTANIICNDDFIKNVIYFNYDDEIQTFNKYKEIIKLYNKTVKVK